MGTRGKLAVALFLILCLLVFIYSASRAGDTGKEPEDSIAMISFLAFIITAALLVVLWLQRTFKHRFSKHFASYLSATPLPDARATPPKFLQSSDSSLPVREDDLWPVGQMLYLVGGGPYGKTPVEGFPIVILTKDTLMISGDRDSLELLADNRDVDTEFWNPDPAGAYHIPTSEISRVLISPWGLTPMLTIWVRDQNGVDRMILRSLIPDCPKSIRTLVTKAKKQMVLSKTVNEWSILEKEIEKRFKVAAPNAIVTLKGNKVSDEDLARLVK